MIDQKFTLPCGAVLKNRIVKSAMSENMATAAHCPGQDFSTLYSFWSQGGAALIISGNVMIDSTSLGEPFNVVIERNHECRSALEHWARAGTNSWAHLWMQINHPGKQSPKFLSQIPSAPSAVSYTSSLKAMFNPPRALKEAEIFDLIDRFAFTATTAKEAGFTGVQIHGAHGYLVSQFLSPKHNERQDKWGGNLENRMRFAMEVYKKIRTAVGRHFPVGIKLNSADFQKGGFGEDESMQVAEVMSTLGIDLIEISGGTYEAPAMMSPPKDSTQRREAYFLEYCEKIRSRVKTPLLLTGGFRTKQGMEQALQSGACDLVGLARALALDPNFARDLLSGETAQSKVRPLTTGITALDKIAPLEITWYTEQLHRMGKGKLPKPNASVKLSLLRTVWSFGIQALKRVRAA